MARSTLRPNRWIPVSILWSVAICAGFSSGISRVEVDHNYVVTRAEELANKPYQPREQKLPEGLRDLAYDDYHRIRFVDEHSLWSGDALPFRAQFFPPGYLFEEPVVLNEFTPTHVQRIPFVRTFFDFDHLDIPGRLPGSINYAGFRFLGHLNSDERWDEIASFLGASYFRALARGQHYGISARGIAINSGAAEPEEFPRFVEFWLGKPAADAQSVVVRGLLDGPSLTGAYSFGITPGETTTVDVNVTLFIRSAIENLGLAPLTSMFWFGENTTVSFGDFRPEVHDSDGLLVAKGEDERVWRPLENPQDAITSEFEGSGGFGLFQRDRDFSSYQDSEARPELRPSVWIEPIEGWPDGRVHLVELPTTTEYADNIVAFWAPFRTFGEGERLDFEYRQHWTNLTTMGGGPSGWVRSTRQTHRVEGRAGRTLFVVDFAIPELGNATESMSVDVSVPDTVQVLDRQVAWVEGNDSWRMTLLFDAAEGHEPVDIRARLLQEEQPITETWVARWTQ